MTFIIMVLLVAVNFTNVVTEFIGIAGSVQLFHISKYISVPLCAVAVWALVVKGDYKGVEKVFLAASVFLYRLHHRGGDVAAGLAPGAGGNGEAAGTFDLERLELRVRMTIGVIGTTITPWMQFYLQSSIVDKGVGIKQYKASRLDVIVGSFFTDIVAWFIVVVCAATLYTHGMRNLTVPSDAAEAMKPIAERYAYMLFAFGLFNASFFAASILPLSTAYTVCEGLGFEAGLDRSFRQAPFFYWLYTALIAAGALMVVVLRQESAMKVAVLSQVLNGVLLPFILFFMLRLINKKELMGKYTNSRWFNIVAWTSWRWWWWGCRR